MIDQEHDLSSSSKHNSRHLKAKEEPLLGWGLELTRDLSCLDQWGKKKATVLGVLVHFYYIVKEVVVSSSQLAVLSPARTLSTHPSSGHQRSAHRQRKGTRGWPLGTGRCFGPSALFSCGGQSHTEILWWEFHFVRGNLDWMNEICFLAPRKWRKLIMISWIPK